VLVVDQEAEQIRHVLDHVRCQDVVVESPPGDGIGDASAVGHKVHVLDARDVHAWVVLIFVAKVLGGGVVQRFDPIAVALAQQRRHAAANFQPDTGCVEHRCQNLQPIHDGGLALEGTSLAIRLRGEPRAAAAGGARPATQ